MLVPKKYTVTTNKPIDDLIGGYIDNFEHFIDVYGWLDYLSGSDRNTLQNALVVESTHVLVTDIYYSDITEKMQVTDTYGQVYQITLVDNPGHEEHHLEIYLKRSD